MLKSTVFTEAGKIHAAEGSDGADGVFRRGLSLGKTAGLAADKERRKLLDYIKENLPDDDSACIIIDRDMQPMFKT